ncbi:MAG: BrnT family toxin [Gammaproteobacteria bacterium]|nr:MAG: BrnT family toxin [Gammaproteobacteria bacterium]
MPIEFDSGKDASNRARHGCSLALAADLDWKSVLAVADRRRDYGERRMIGYGLIGARLYWVVFVRRRRRRRRLRIISFRKANRREFKRYEQVTQDRKANAARGSGHSPRHAR